MKSGESCRSSRTSAFLRIVKNWRHTSCHMTYADRGQYMIILSLFVSFESDGGFYITPRSLSFNCHAHAERMVSASVDVAFQPRTSLA